MAIGFYDSPAGLLKITATELGISEVSFVSNQSNDPMVVQDQDSIVENGIRQLKQYFEGQLKAFDLPLDPIGTPFQKQVWHSLKQIPFGKTVSYLDIAKLLGDPNKIRAVGGANGKNPIAIIVPCHRVIGSDGSLTGYAGGMDKKRWLLQFEGGLPRELFA